MAHHGQLGSGLQPRGSWPRRYPTADAVHHPIRQGAGFVPSERERHQGRLWLAHGGNGLNVYRVTLTSFAKQGASLRQGSFSLLELEFVFPGGDTGNDLSGP